MTTEYDDLNEDDLSVDDEETRDLLEDRQFLRARQEARSLNRKRERIDGLTLTGVRLSDPDDPDAPGMVVTLTADEAEGVVAAIKAALEARKV